jgi:hypothetical protein
MRFELFLAALPFALAAPTIQTRAPIILPREGHAVPGKWILKMKNDALGHLLEDIFTKLNKDPEHVYEFGKFKGFSAELSDNLVEVLSRMPGVSELKIGWGNH